MEMIVTTLAWAVERVRCLTIEHLFCSLSRKPAVSDSQKQDATEREFLLDKL
jgi:hypothetical protein